MVELKVYEVVCGIVETKDGFLIAKRSETSRSGYWEFPGGGVEKGESKEEAVIRELKEELEIDCKVLSYVGEIVDHRSEYDIHVSAYRCEWLSGDIHLNDHSEYRFVTAPQLYHYHFEAADKPILDILNQQANKGC